MKSPNFLSLLIVFLLVSTTTVFAQSSMNDLSEEQKAEMKENMKRQVAELNLSDSQKPEFEAISKKYAEQMMSVKETSGSKFKKMRKMKGISKDKNKEMKALLNDEQYSVYLAQQEEMRKKMKARQGK